MGHGTEPVDPIVQTAEGVLLTVSVQPQAGRTEYVGRHGKAFKFRVAAPPVEGKANEVLCAHLAERFTLPNSAVEIRAGHASRQKRILLKGVPADRVLKSLASETALAPRLHQVNVSNGGVPKLPVAEARITLQGVAGDRQRNRKVHGGPDQAVCLYSLEVIEALKGEGHPIAPGSTGENLTLAGLEWDRIKPGVRLRVGESVRLEVVSYTAPCEHNARWFVSGNFLRISQKRHPGWSRVYARVLQEGLVRQGDPVVIEVISDGR